MGLKSDLEGLTDALVEKEARLRDLEGRLGSKVGGRDEILDLGEFGMI